MNEFIQKNKVLVIGAVAVAVVASLALVMGGGGGAKSITGNDTSDNSKNVVTSQDKLDNGAVKMGNVGSVGGNLDLSKTTTTTSDNSKKSEVAEGNE